MEHFTGHLIVSDLRPLEDLQSCLSSITTTDLLITGDFNPSEFDWTMNHPTNSSERYYVLSDITEQFLVSNG